VENKVRSEADIKLILETLYVSARCIDNDGLIDQYRLLGWVLGNDDFQFDNTLESIKRAIEAGIIIPEHMEKEYLSYQTENDFVQRKHDEETAANPRPDYSGLMIEALKLTSPELRSAAIKGVVSEMANALEAACPVHGAQKN
jgi:hypothetical protein